MPTVTIFKNAKTADKPSYVGSAKLVEYIRDGRWKKLIDKLNSFEYESEQQKAFKNTEIPGIVWQGKFSYRSDAGISEHSGLVAIDIDHLPEDELIHYRNLLIKNRYTHILFRSPRRNGLKIIIKIPASIEEHKEYLAAIGEEYKKHAEKYYDHFDDLSRLCFVSYDPDIYYNPDSAVYKIKKPLKKYPGNSSDISKIAEDVAGTFNRVRAWAEKRSTYEDQNKHKHLILVFSACNRFGIPKDDAIKLVYNRYANTPGTETVSYFDFENRADSVYRLYAHDFGKKSFDDATAPTYAPIRPADDHRPAIQTGFPTDVFPQGVRDLISELNGSLNYSKDFLSIAVMFVVATLNGNKFKLRVKNGWNAPTVFWFAAVGEPGTMKSHPISTIISPIEAIDRKAKRIYDDEYRDYEQALAEPKNKTLIHKPKFRQIRITDATLESIHEIHAINKRGLGYYKDELVGFINNMNQYRKGADEQFWLESFNNKSYIVNRVSKNPNLIEDTMINIIGTIQPNVLSRITREYEGNGLTDRFLYTSSEENIYPLTEKEIGQEWFEWWDGAVNTIHNTMEFIDKDDTVVINMPNDCLKKLIEIDTRVCALQRSDDISESLKNYLSKSKTYLPRFTLLVALMDWLFTGVDLEIKTSHIERADRIMQYFIESSRSIFSKTEKDKEISDVAAVKKGQTIPEMILFLHEKGFKNAEIARKINKSRAYVGQVVAQWKKK